MLEKFLFDIFETNDLYEPIITDNDPGFGDISDIFGYLPVYVRV